MKRLIGMLFLVLLFGIVTGQTVIDSLKKQLAISGPDTNRVAILSRLSLAHVQSNHEMAMKYAQEGLALARKLKFQSGEADCLRRSGIALLVQGRYPEALDIIQKAVNISEKINHHFGIAAGLGHLGNIHMEQHDYPKARAYYHRYLKIAEAMQNDLEQANALRGLGRSHLRQNHLDSASFYYSRVYARLKNKPNNRIFSVLYIDLGELNAKSGNAQEAMTFFRKSIPYSSSEMAFQTLSEAYLGIANLYRTGKQPDSCIFYAQQALEAAEKINYPKGIVAASRLLSEVYEGRDDQLAFKFHKKATAVNDSLFNTEKASQVQNLFFLEEQRRQTEEAARIKYKNQLRLYILLSALGVFLFLGIMLYRNNRSKQKANNLLQSQKLEIHQQRNKAEQALDELKATQAQLIQSEKMASLGELTAGIAHEIQNPLNFVNNFSEVSTELLDEMIAELKNNNKEDAVVIAGDIKQNLEKILHHGKRADTIVKGMLQHSRTSSAVKEPTDINKLADEYLRLAYHGLRAKDNFFNATLKTEYDESIGNINIIPQDIGRVIVNLITNAFYAVTEKKKQEPNGYEPLVTVSTKKLEGKIEIRVGDNGNGIPQKVLDKIFQPFFTTKPTGQGTGLGLSLSYDIIKAHGGEIKVETTEGEGAQFIIEIPLNT